MNGRMKICPLFIRASAPRGPLPKKDLILVVIYRQPNSGNLDYFLDSVDQLLQKIDKMSNEIVIAGDMNLDLLKYETHPQTAQ